VQEAVGLPFFIRRERAGNAGGVFIADNARSRIQEPSESPLLEMTVGGQGLDDSTPPHQDEAEGIAEQVLFVEACFEQLHGLTMRGSINIQVIQISRCSKRPAKKVNVDRRDKPRVAARATNSAST
jgi:hypothetical protein